MLTSDLRNWLQNPTFFLVGESGESVLGIPLKTNNPLYNQTEPATRIPGTSVRSTRTPPMMDLKPPNFQCPKELQKSPFSPFGPLHGSEKLL